MTCTSLTYYDICTDYNCCWNQQNDTCITCENNYEGSSMTIVYGIMILLASMITVYILIYFCGIFSKCCKKRNKYPGIFC